VQLSDKEKQELKALIDRGEPLPARYRHTLFAEPHEAELIWPGKTHEVANVVLPFQSIEQIDEPRSGTAAAQSDLFQMDSSTGRQSGGWTNKLIWGDNKLVLSSLKNGPLRREIERAGGLKLIYIDPPFDVGSDFSFQIEVGSEKVLPRRNTGRTRIWCARNSTRILTEARAAQTLPWEPRKVLLYRTVFPQMTNWLPDEEGARLRFVFETEIKRLEAA
jgi:hypothetical protein